jgi:hypothetical protein
MLFEIKRNLVFKKYNSVYASSTFNFTGVDTGFSLSFLKVNTKLFYFGELIIAFPNIHSAVAGSSLTFFKLLLKVRLGKFIVNESN